MVLGECFKMLAYCSELPLHQRVSLIISTNSYCRKWQICLLFTKIGEIHEDAGVFFRIVLLMTN